MSKCIIRQNVAFDIKIYITYVYFDFTMDAELKQKITLFDIMFCATVVILYLKMSNLKRIREQNNLSQGQLAIKSKVSLRTIKSYEQRYRDINKASAGILNKLANALDCSINDLLEDDAASRII